MKPKILLSNDDGIFAPGLQALWETLASTGKFDISIVAPLSEKSGTGVSITWEKPIVIQKVDWEGATRAWSVDGTPADCIKMGMRVLIDFKPDLIVSGINAGSNAGRNVLHSGTVGAVIEGILRGIPGVAFSCEDGKHPNYPLAQKHVAAIVEYLLKNPLPGGTFLNVNFPHNVEKEVKGFKLTRQGKGRWAEDPLLHLETANGPSYWLGGKPEELDEIPDCDIALLKDGYVTAVPIHVHELTDREVVSKRKNDFETFFTS